MEAIGIIGYILGYILVWHLWVSGYYGCRFLRPLILRTVQLAHWFGFFLFLYMVETVSYDPRKSYVSYIV